MTKIPFSETDSVMRGSSEPDTQKLAQSGLDLCMRLWKSSRTQSLEPANKKPLQDAIQRLESWLQAMQAHDGLVATSIAQNPLQQGLVRRPLLCICVFAVQALASEVDPLRLNKGEVSHDVVQYLSLDRDMVGDCDTEAGSSDDYRNACPEVLDISSLIDFLSRQTRILTDLLPNLWIDASASPFKIPLPRKQLVENNGSAAMYGKPVHTLHEMFPKADPIIRERLAKQSHIRYPRLHRILRPILPLAGLSISQAPMPEETTSQNPGHATSTASSQTAQSQDTASEASSVSPVLEDTLGFYPPSSKTSACPLCWRQIQSADSLSWSKHVFEHLKPYTCLRTDCPESGLGQQYADWLSHEKRHRLSKGRMGSAGIGSTANDTTARKLQDLFPGETCLLCRQAIEAGEVKYATHMAAHMEAASLLSVPPRSGVTRHVVGRGRIATRARAYTPESSNTGTPSPFPSPSKPGRGLFSRRKTDLANYSCSFCPMHSLERTELELHMLTHKTRCDICFQSFSSSTDLARHEMTHQNDRKVFECQGRISPTTSWGCGLEFDTAKELGEHFRSDAGDACLAPLVAHKKATDKYAVLHCTATSSPPPEKRRAFSRWRRSSGQHDFDSSSSDIAPRL